MFISPNSPESASRISQRMTIPDLFLASVAKGNEAHALQRPKNRREMAIDIHFVNIRGNGVRCRADSEGATTDSLGRLRVFHQVESRLQILPKET